MTADLKKKEDDFILLNLSITEDEYFPLFEDHINHYARTVELRGFRKGHIPLQYIKKTYGKDILLNIIINLSEGKLNDYLVGKCISPVGEITKFSNTLADFREDQFANPSGDIDFQYKFLGIAIKNTDIIRDLVVEKPIATQISKKELDKNILKLQNSYGESIQKEVVSENSIIEGILSNGYNKEKVWINIQDLDEKKSIFLDHKKGDTISFDYKDTFGLYDIGIKFESGTNYYEFNLKNPEFNPNDNISITIDKISEIIPKEIDEEFFKKVFPENTPKTEQELRDRLESEYLLAYKEITDVIFKKNLMRSIEKHVEAQIPKKYFLENWQKEEHELTEEEREEYTTRINRLKTLFTLRKIGDDHAISIDENDMLDIFADINPSLPKKREKAIIEMQKFIDNLDDYSKTLFYSSAKEKKILNFIKSKVKTENVEMDSDQLLDYYHNNN